MKKKTIGWSIGILAIIGILIFAFSADEAVGFETVSNYEGDMTIYKSGSCGCCGVYATYFKDRGNSATKIANLDNLNALKEQYGIPPAMNSCHTTVIGDYFVEGHIPLEAVEKLLKEKPAIKGIAMPGMPSGSPGMPGNKEEFIIYAVNLDDSYEEWMRL